MPSKEVIWVEKHQISDLCVAGVVSYQGRQPYMEDRFSVISNINNSEVSLYAIFDGHSGSFAADFCIDIIMPSISDKLSEILDLVRAKAEITKAIEKEKAKNAIKAKNAKFYRKKGDDVQKEEISEEIPKNEEESSVDPTPEPEPNPLEAYITLENTINYEKLLFDEIINFDKVLTERMAKATLFCGTTANIVLVDLASKLIICANVGDSRAVMCDVKGNAFALSHDHKPNNPEELTRIRENGGTISQKSGCWSKLGFEKTKFWREVKIR
jgi:protein phosphatase 1L